MFSVLKTFSNSEQELKNTTRKAQGRRKTKAEILFPPNILIR